ncbi:four helix bundle protein [Candidatus Roizmanbacteria bacterium RIFCSPHIGHO2_12_FULL_38_13]|nr:MAG: four helix bundle protein [Candidatus Roizmanbacteria bacterium RIFCSPHIGHO2_12_FULL_38_13]
MSHNSLIPPHGGYKQLESYKNTSTIYDGTVVFCKKYKSYLTYKLIEQMTGAARSGKQNIAEGTVISGTSKKTELKLIGVAKGSLKELLEDYEDFLRQNGYALWGKNDTRSRKIRSLVYVPNKSYTTYKTYIENSSPEIVANTMICLINQTTYLIDRQLISLENKFLRNGGFTERMYKFRQMKTNKL